MKRVDARGLSCPEPVIQTKNAMASKEAEYEVLVDNVVAKENVSRFVMHQGSVSYTHLTLPTILLV